MVSMETIMSHYPVAAELVARGNKNNDHSTTPNHGIHGNNNVPLPCGRQSLLPGATRTMTIVPLTKTKKMLHKGMKISPYLNL